MKRFLFFILLLTNSVFAQKKAQKLSSLAINFSDHNAKFQVLNVKRSIRMNEQLTYHWYAFNKIFETKGGYDGKVLHGPYTSFYQSENLKEKGFFHLGLKTGKWTSWYENGQIKDVAIWKNGLLNGMSKAFDNNGNLLSETNYSKGSLYGDKIVYSEGKVIEIKKYKNGKEVKVEGKKARKEKIKPVVEKKEKEIKKKKDKKPAAEIPPALAPNSTKEKKKSFFEKKESEKKAESHPVK